MYQHAIYTATGNKHTFRSIEPEPSLQTVLEKAAHLRILEEKFCEVCFQDGPIRKLDLRKGCWCDEDEDEDLVNHPTHYNSHPSGVKCIQVTEHMNFCRGSAMKYLWRAGLKGDEIEDLKKARWYLDREIKRLEGNRS